MMKKNYNLLLLLLLATTHSYAAIISQIVINPIQICSDDGSVCANPNQILYEDEIDKIYAQAGIDIVFNPFSQFNETDYLSLDYDGQNPSSALDFLGAIRPAQDLTVNVINMWFVQTLTPSNLYGIGLIDQEGILIADRVFNDNRIDTLAHEVAHNLALDHPDALNANYLISAGNNRNVPSSISDITNDGITGTSLFSAADLNTITNSRYVIALPVTNLPTTVPAPTSIYLFLIGLLFISRDFKLKLH